MHDGKRMRTQTRPQFEGGEESKDRDIAANCPDFIGTVPILSLCPDCPDFRLKSPDFQKLITKYQIQLFFGQ